MYRLKVILPPEARSSDPEDRMVALITALMSTAHQAALDFNVPHCAIYGGLVIEAVATMIQNDHLGCAAKLADEVGIMIAMEEKKAGQEQNA